MLGRFFGGFFASAPLAVVGGALADIWDPLDRAYGVCAFAAGAFAGPVAGPIMGGFIVSSASCSVGNVADTACRLSLIWAGDGQPGLR